MNAAQNEATTATRNQLIWEWWGPSGQLTPNGSFQPQTVRWHRRQTTRMGPSPAGAPDGGAGCDDGGRGPGPGPRGPWVKRGSLIPAGPGPQSAAGGCGKRVVARGGTEGAGDGARLAAGAGSVGGGDDGARAPPGALAGRGAGAATANPLRVWRSPLSSPFRDMRL
jgi:hypothetical protein